MNALRLFVIAGEPSGDRLGGALVAALRAAGTTVELAGVGGEALAAEGLRSLFPINDIAVMGIAEVVPRLPNILRRLRQTVRAARAFRPDIVLSIDSPDFGLRVQKALKTAGEPALRAHYVAPSVWAWRPGRARKYAALLDHLMALLPFEPPYFHEQGLSCDFTGHPLLRWRGRFDASGAAFRAAHGLGDAPLLTILPGSRRGEVSKLAQPFAQVLHQLRAQRANLRAVVPVAPNVAPLMAQGLATAFPADTLWLHADPADFVGSERRKFEAMAASQAALAASGTVSLELAMTRTPMVIAYRTHPLTAALARRLLRINTVTLVNLIHGENVVPEFLQERCTPALLTPALVDVLADGAAQRVAFTRVAEILGQGDPAARAAQSLLAAWARKRGGQTRQQ